MQFLNKLTVHNAKKTIASHTSASPVNQQANADPAYDAAHHHFDTYHSHLLAIQKCVNDYATHSYGTLSASFNLINHLGNAVTQEQIAGKQQQQTNNAMWSTLRDSHVVLQGEKEKQISFHLHDGCSKPVEAELLVHDRILKTIDQRSELAKELDYYTGKLNTLIKEHHDREAAGKTVSEKDREKLERNQKKKDDTSAVFNTVNSQLISEMKQIVEAREELLFNVAKEFESVEQEYVELYQSAVQSDLDEGYKAKSGNSAGNGSRSSGSSNSNQESYQYKPQSSSSISQPGMPHPPPEGPPPSHAPPAYD